MKQGNQQPHGHGRRNRRICTINKLKGEGGHNVQHPLKPIKRNNTLFKMTRTPVTYPSHKYPQTNEENIAEDMPHRERRWTASDRRPDVPDVKSQILLATYARNMHNICGVM